MTVTAGLLLGAGLCLLMVAVTSPGPAPRTRRWHAATADLLVQAGAPGVTPGALVGASAGLGVITGLLVLGLSRTPVIAVCLALLAAASPFTLVRSRARRRRAAVRELWPEVVDHLASGIRAGLALPEALTQVGERGPEALRPAFRTFGEDHRSGGRFEDNLDALKSRLADPVADRIIEALRLTRAVGGTDVGRLLRTLAQMLRDDLRTRGELEARQSWTVGAARLAAAAPWLVLLMLTSRPETAAAYSTTSGVLVVVGGAAVTVAAYQTMVRIGRLPEDVRVLR